MGRRSVDHDRVKGTIRHTSVGIDDSVLPFVIAMADNGKVSSGIRACIRAAIFHQTKHGRLPAAYIKHLIQHDRRAADDYLTRFPEQCPEGHRPVAPLAPDAFEGWDDPE